ncbi:hypothetical protein KZZ52_52485 [Dactylosporangium sp. AC04546]|nr:hypothetical protein [Dactylosporangium sp. AC04546]WVK82480.1 hypothetical protein KZZ52_52485 [Dactylosporangium sp. AC04546]
MPPDTLLMMLVAWARTSGRGDVERRDADTRPHPSRRAAVETAARE